MSTAPTATPLNYSNTRIAARIPGAPFFVIAVWALMLLAALAYVWRYGSNVPSWDDWDMVPTLTGAQPVTLSWLWSQHSEHRIPLPRLVMLALNWPFGTDFRIAMYFNVILMGGLCLAMIFTARRLRGKGSYADVFFPLLLLNLGQGLNFIWGWQVEFFLSTVIAGAALLLILRTGPTPSLPLIIALSACLLLLVGCGAHGVVLVPALGLWVAIAGVVRWRSGDSRGKRDGLLIIALTMAVILLASLYFVGYEPVPFHIKYRNLKITLRTASKFITSGFAAAPAEPPWWPWSARIVIIMLLVSGAVSCVAIWRRPAERLRALGLFLFMGAMTCLALAVGTGRDTFDPRYITLAVPLWCAVYFVWDRYLPRNVAPFAGLLLVLIACAALWTNTRAGLKYGQDLKVAHRAWETDISAGMPLYQIIVRHARFLHTDQKVPTEYMPLLRQSGIGVFAALRDNPPLREIAVPVETAELQNAAWISPDTLLAGETPTLLFTLPSEQYVAGIRLRYTHTNKINYQPYVQLWWKSSAQKEFFLDKQFWKQSPTGDRLTWERGTWFRRHEPEPTMLVWVCDKVKQIRLQPDHHACTFKISELVLLVPEDAK